MKKSLLSFSNYLRDIKKIYFAVLFLFSSSFGLAQTITTSKTVTANAGNCGIVNVKLDITGSNPVTRNSDVILVIDVSGSMGNTISGDTKTSMDYAKLAAKSFISQASANTSNRIAIVSYTTNAKLELGLTYLNAAGVTALNAKIDALTATNNTNIQDGIIKAETELEANGRFDCSTARSIILLTDGVTNRTGPSGNTTTCNTTSTSSTCVTSAINAATNAKTTVKSSVTYNNQIFSVGLFGGISGNINTVGSDQYVAKYTLDGIQGSASYITQSGANLTSIYNQIATQISWVAQSLIQKETVIPGFTIGSITTTKGTTSVSGQVITWNTDFLNSETITLNYQLTPTGTACGTQTVSTSTLNYQNTACANDSKTITSPSYFVPCPPVITGVLSACGSTTLTATTNAASPTYVWYKDNVEISGQTASTLVVNASGAYKVKVKNGSTNCELTSAASNVTISPAAALTAPANATIAGCGTNAITGLVYNTASTNITLVQLNAAGGSLSNSASLGTYTISYSDSSTGTCPIVVTRTFKVSTSCGNVTANQTITIQDTTAPSWTTAANSLNVTLQCSDTAGLATAQNQAPVATDNCGGTVTYTKTSGVLTLGTCINSGTYTNTWIAKDLCNNLSSTFTQVITIQDTTAPTWTTTANSLNVILQCSDTAGLATAQNQAPVATDNCGGTVAYTKTSGVFVAGTCVNSGTYTNTWIAKDVCNNSSTTFTQVITIQDTTAPNWTTTANSLNVTLQCSDTAGLATAQNQAPVATDNCGGTVTYTKTSGVFTAETCVNSGTYTNTWIAKDVCNNSSSTFTQVITIQDTTAPTWTTTANSLNVTLQCSDTAGLTTAQNQAPVATDNCGGTVTYSKTSGVFTAGTCINSGTYTNIWIAKDVCNNSSSTFTQVITIQDTTAPSWTTTANSLNVTLQCSDTAGLATAQNQAPVATDNCGGTVTYTKTSGVFTAGTCINSGTYTNTWIAKDVCNNSSSTFTQVITIQDTTAPTWTTTANSLNVTLQCSDTTGLTTAQNQAPSATDNCGGAVTYNKTSGVFTVGTCINSGTYTNTWIAKDICNNLSSTFTQVITIQDTTAPTWTTASNSLNLTLQCSDTAGLATAQNQAPVATDNCGGTVTYTKTSGVFTAGTCVNSGTYTNTWIAKDVCNNSSSIFTQVITIQDTTAPTWTTATNSLNITLQCSDLEGLALAQAKFPVANDSCDSDVSNIIKTSGQFIASEGCANSGTYTNIWIVKDNCGNTSETFTQVITIEDTIAPTWTTVSNSLNVTLQCSDVEGLTLAQVKFPVANDFCDSDVSNIIKTSGQFIASENCANSGTYTNTWIVKDDCGNTSETFTQVITIEDITAPTWTTQNGSLNVTVQCSDVEGLTLAQTKFPIASDSCDSDVSNIVKTSGQFITSEGCANSGTYTNTWIVKDDCGNTSDTFMQVITIEDTTAPTWTTQNGSLNVTLQCSDVEGLALAQAKFPIASDSCDGDVSNIVKTSGQFIASEGCANSGTYTNTWIVKDDCGNTSDAFTQVITIEDTTAPTWTTQNGSLDVTIQCSDTDGLTTAQNLAPVAIDNCDGTVTYTKISGELQRGNCGSTGTYTNTWTAKDICNNTSTVFTQVITVKDTAVPTWITQSGSLDITLQCSNIEGLAAAQNQAPTATANCSFVTYTKTRGSFIASENCANSGTYTNSWIAKDDCGNVTDSFTQVIIIEDTTAPTWATTANSLNVTVQCSDVEGLTLAQAKFPIATDSCDSDVSNILKTSGQFIASEGCANAGTYTNTWVVKDDCGNASDTFMQVITIEDTTTPTWTTQNSSLNVNLQCSDFEGLTLAQAKFPIASDSCDSDVSNIVKTSGQFITSENCANSGTYTNTWVVKDDCGNTSETFTQIITIEDTTAPTWTTTANSLNVTLQCSDVEGLTLAQAKFPVANDSCDSDVSNIVKTSGQFVASEGCANSGTYTNTWIVKDDCGNTSDTFTQVITIEDTTAPTWTTAANSLDVTLQCSDNDGLITAQNQTPVAIDNCDGTVTYTKITGELQRGNCGSTGTYTNTWTAKDICNNTSTVFTQVITVKDTAVPTWITQAGSLDITLQCSNIEGLAAAQNQAPTATANCSFVTYTKTSGSFIASENCVNSGTYTNSWIAKDDCGNVTDSFTQVITIEDTIAPTWTTQNGSLDVTVQCSDVEALASAQAKFPIASDSCDSYVSNIVKTSGQFIASEDCANSGTYTNTWVVKDDCGNTSETFTQIITIEDTTAPIWTTQNGSLNATLQCSDVEGLTLAQAKFPIANDSCDGDVSNIVKTSGQFIASEGCANSGTYTNTWVVKDDCGNTSDTFTQIITIEDTTAPTWATQNGSLNITLQCSDTEGLALAQAKFPIATDLCDADVSNIIKTNGQFIASEGCTNSGTYTNTWVVKDDCGNTSDVFTQVITIEDTTAPTWTTQNGSLDVTLQCSDVEVLALAQAKFPLASDSCDSDVSNIIKTSGQFIASEGCANAGTYTNRWVVKDDCGNTSETFTQIITIEDTIAPTWTTQNGSLNITLQCSDIEGLTLAQAKLPVASDSCDSDVSNIVKTNGQFIASEGCANSGTYTNTWVVKDECGNTSDSFTQVITIEDKTAPNWTTQNGSLNVTVQCSDLEGLALAQAKFPIATDSCDSNVSNIVKISGQFIASEGCANSGTYTNTWIVKDDCGNTSETFTQVITIEDTTKPIFSGDLPTNITVSCDAVPEPAQLTVSDNCNSDLPIVFTETKSDIQNECSSNYTLTRTWTTSDCSANTASYTQIITVRDTTAPTGTAPSDVAGLQSINDIPNGSPQDLTNVSDNCDSNVTITVSDSNNGASGCNGTAYVLTRTYTLTDCSGNKTELVQTFTVENKVSVSAVVKNVSCLGGTDGMITVTNSPGSTVVIRNQNNEVVGNTNLPAGTYTLTATSAVNNENQICTASTTVTITEPPYKVKISGQIINIDNSTPIANVPVTLIPQGTTTGPILFRLTDVNGMYSFTDMILGSYLVQVQDANLNSAYQLYPIDSSLFFTTLEECKFQVHNFEYGLSTLPVLGDYVWYDTNSNGIQDEWYDANNDGIVTKNIPDSNGAIDYSLWEWIDFNGDGSYTGPQNVGELNAGGFGNALSPNVIIDGPNGYHKEVIVGIQGFWRNRPDFENPYGDYNVKLVRDANFDTVSQALGATGLVKVIPSATAKNIASKTGKTQLHTICQITSPDGFIATLTPQDLVHLDLDFGVVCKTYSDIVANDDNAGPIVGVNVITPNVLNVLSNDTIEGVIVTPSDVIITTVTPNEFLQLNPDGSVDVLPNAPAGTLTMVYQICEADETSNCDTATVTVTVVAPVMTVTATPICVNDVPYVDYLVTPGNFTPQNGVTIAWSDNNNTIISTMTDLPLSGRILWPGAVVDQAGNGVDWPGWIFQNNQWIQGADGFETLRPTATLTISVNPSETITVNYPPADPYCIARPTFSIVANDDTAGPINGIPGATNVLNVYTNDTLNNAAVNPNDVTLTLVTPDPTGALTLNPEGSVNVAPNTPAGTYTLTYQICENADFGNCDTAIVTVTVTSSVIVANDDNYNNIGCNTFGLVGNVLSNDLLNQAPATLELVNFTLLSENNNTEKANEDITIDASGNVTVSSSTPAGTYTYMYQICEKLNPNNCDTATVTITVVPNGVINITSEACNDDSSLINLHTLLPENTPLTGTWTDTSNSNALQGNMFNPYGLMLGNYKFEYLITDENCPRSVILTMEVNDDCRVLACGTVVIHNAFSPNGDGKNDYFQIDNIDEVICYPENTVEIYNRWGILVFDTINYNNTTNAFDGTSRGRTTIKQSDGLPTGTYFYIINYKSLDGNNVAQNHKKDGYLYLSR